MDRQKPAAPEREGIRIRTYAIPELIHRIYKGDSLPQDRRFLPKDRGGVFAFFHLPHLVGIYAKDEYYPLLEVNGVAVGLAKLQQDTDQPDRLGISFISVDPKFQGRGYASLLVDELMRFAKSREATVYTSSYTDAGYEKLKPIFKRYADKHGVPFIDTEGRI